MTESYHTVCHTCGEEQVTEEVSQASHEFHRHSEQGCDVEVRNLVIRSGEHSQTGIPESW